MGMPLPDDKPRPRAGPALQGREREQRGAGRRGPNWTGMPATLHIQAMPSEQQSWCGYDGNSPGADLRRRDARPGRVEHPARRDRYANPHHPRDRARHPAGLGGDGHGDRGRAGDRDGAGRRARRHPPQHADRAAGRRSPQGQEIRGRHGREPGHDPPGRDPGRRAAADGRAQDLRHPGRRARQPAGWPGS